jgi:hypothetical protein
VELPPSVLGFADFELDRGASELRRGGRVVHLERIPLDLLFLLAERRGNSDRVPRQQRASVLESRLREAHARSVLKSTGGQGFRGGSGQSAAHSPFCRGGTGATKTILAQAESEGWVHPITPTVEHF